MYIVLIQRKVTRMEHEYQDIVIKTEYLKLSKQKIKKDIEFYKAAINKLVPTPISSPLSTTSTQNDPHALDIYNLSYPPAIALSICLVRYLGILVKDYNSIENDHRTPISH